MKKIKKKPVKVLVPKEEDLVVSMINKPILLKEQNSKFDEPTYFKMKKVYKYKKPLKFKRLFVTLAINLKTD